jgi:hypothetical protein
MKPEVEPIIAKAKAERRRFRRVQVNLPGRLFIPALSRENPCKILDLSPGGAAVESELVPDADAQIVLYVDGFGRLEGNVVNRSATGFAVHFHCTALKRERIAEQLTLFANKGLLDEADLRRHDRTPAQGFTRYTRADGETVKCEVLDLSLSGVSVKTKVRPPVGEFVLIGQMAGRIARHHEQGIAIEFVGTSHNPRDRQTAEKLRARITVAR